MDYPFEIREILSAYLSCIPGEIRRPFCLHGESDPDSLVPYWERALTGGTKRSIQDSFIYYDALRRAGSDRRYALSYNEPASCVWSFVIERVFSLFSPATRSGLLKELGASSHDLPARLVEPSARNAFRRSFLAEMNGPILSFLYSMVYLMGFSSGGEASFLTRVFPLAAEWKGHLLDAGGGSGFAALLLSTRGPVTYVDFSPFRAERAEAVAAAAREDARFFGEMLDLIDRESAVFGLSLERSLIPPLGGEPPSYRSADLARLPDSFGPFDGAILTDVLEHTTDPESALAAVAKTLAPGAPLLLTVPTDANGVVGKLREEEEGYAFPFLLHVSFFSDERIRKMTDAADLDVEELSYYSYATTSCVGPAPMEVLVLARKR